MTVQTTNFLIYTPYRESLISLLLCRTNQILPISEDTNKLAAITMRLAMRLQTLSYGSTSDSGHRRGRQTHCLSNQEYTSPII